MAQVAVLRKDDLMDAYVLIQTQVGKAPEVAAALMRISGVTSALTVSGPYDVIAEASARDIDHLGQVVVSQIHSVEGITRTTTCPVVNLD